MCVVDADARSMARHGDENSGCKPMRTLPAALAILVAATAGAQLYDARECGSDAVNWAKAEFSALDPADPGVAATFERLIDLYWVDPADRWCSPTGASGTGWGHDKGLMYFALYDAGLVYWELVWSGVEFSEEQTGKLEGILADAGQAALNGSFYYFGTCNLYRGRVNIDNSCAEDDESISKFLAMVKNLFPRVADRLGGDALVTSLERQFLEKAFSTDYEHGGGLLLLNGEVVLPNHGGPSIPYAGVNIIGLNNARDTYLLSGHPLPNWYAHANALSLFRQMQTKALPDGSAFTDDCLLNSGRVVPCNDPGGMNAVPTMLPAGRFVRAVFGDQAFRPGLYAFEACDPSTIDAPDRANQYCGWNPGTLPLRILPIPGWPALIDIRWLAAEGANQYDVWAQTGRIASGVTDTSYTFQGVPCGVPFSYAVYARGTRGRILGGAWGSLQLECAPRPVRRHLARWPSQLSPP